MENTFEYKGYIGQFRYEPGDQAIHGTVIGLRDVVPFQGTNIDELCKAFEESVDGYLQWCELELAGG